MLKIPGALAFALALLLASCASHSDQEARTHYQPYWAPPRGLASPVTPAPPPSVSCLRPGMTRREVFHCLGRAGAVLRVYPPDRLGHDWEEVLLPDGRLDLFFQLHSSPEQWKRCEPIPVQELQHRPGDELIRFRFTNRENWVLWWGVPVEDPPPPPCHKVK